MGQYPITKRRIERTVVNQCLDGSQVKVADSQGAVIQWDLTLAGLTNAEWQGKLVDGVELCRILKEKSPKHLPVLLATAHAMAGDRERFLEASGADGYLEKPVYDSAALVAKVRELME